jgi:hypothetical protein
MLNLFSGHDGNTFLGKFKDCKAEAQRLADITSFKGKVSKYSTAILKDGEYIDMQKFEVISNGLTFKEWKQLGMPLVDKVKVILGYI